MQLQITKILVSMGEVNQLHGVRKVLPILGT